MSDVVARLQQLADLCGALFFVAAPICGLVVMAGLTLFILYLLWRTARG